MPNQMVTFYVLQSIIIDSTQDYAKLYQVMFHSALF